MALFAALKQAASSVAASNPDATPSWQQTWNTPADPAWTAQRDALVAKYDAAFAHEGKLQRLTALAGAGLPMIDAHGLTILRTSPNRPAFDAHINEWRRQHESPRGIDAVLGPVGDFLDPLLQPIVMGMFAFAGGTLLAGGGTAGGAAAVTEGSTISAVEGGTLTLAEGEAIAAGWEGAVATSASQNAALAAASSGITGIPIVDELLSYGKSKAIQIAESTLRGKASALINGKPSTSEPYRPGFTSVSSSGLGALMDQIYPGFSDPASTEKSAGINPLFIFGGLAFILLVAVVVLFSRK